MHVLLEEEQEQVPLHDGIVKGWEIMVVDVSAVAIDTNLVYITE